MSENSTPELPPLSEEAIGRMERAIFDEITDEAPRRPTAALGRMRPRRRWLTGLGIAAAFVVGALVAPPLLSMFSAPSSLSDAAPVGASAESIEMHSTGLAPAGAAPETADGAGGTAASALTAGDVAGRDIITTAQIDLRVADVRRAADALTALARENDGYVEAADIGSSGDAPVDSTRADSQRAPSSPNRGTITLRVPAADLTSVVDSVGAEGDVLQSSISRQDVTSTAIDLRARVDASEASVQRLTELMSKSGSVGDLISAESALSERQAQLESYRQQLKSLDEQVSMSTVHVQLTRRTSAAQADATGFVDGLLNGWNGLVVTLNAVVVALGFLLPWLAIAAVVIVIVRLIRRRARRTPES
ncbi:DUF4349 domain-containing protein [Microbacterium soli]|uniref:DUF4349 domain-containing protein n=1 Tax=Microbacterium soli TaxID=446075 RepID=A0ABP7MK86_9MICO